MQGILSGIWEKADSFIQLAIPRGLATGLFIQSLCYTFSCLKLDNRFWKTFTLAGEQRKYAASHIAC